MNDARIKAMQIANISFVSAYASDVANPMHDCGTAIGIVQEKAKKTHEETIYR